MASNPRSPFGLKKTVQQGFDASGFISMDPSHFVSLSVSLLGWCLESFFAGSVEGRSNGPYKPGHRNVTQGVQVPNPKP